MPTSPRNAAVSAAGPPASRRRSSDHLDYARLRRATSNSLPRRIAGVVAEIVINPPASELGRVNAVLNGRGSRYEMRGYRGPLSLKSMVRGNALWETESGRFDLTPGAVLILNDGEEYSVTVESLQPVETFCVFFERGFVEDAVRAATASDSVLLDEPFDHGAIEFGERLHF